MADLVFGLAKSAVTETLNIAKSAIEEEEKLKRSVKLDLLLISDEFQMMHSFLNVANEGAADDMVRTCVTQVRDMALDVEDCIETVVHLDNKSRWWRRMLQSCMPMHAPEAALNDAVANIELLKARVEAMGQRNMRYSNVSCSGTSSKPTKQMDLDPVPNATALEFLNAARVDAKRNKLDLAELINTKCGAPQVISVWGTGLNLGISSITRKAFDRSEICKNFSKRAWVKLVHPFDVHQSIRDLLIQFYTNNKLQQGRDAYTLQPMEVMEATETGLINELRKQARNQRYLVVLEDVSTMAELDSIRSYLPDGSDGSCIIINTEKLEIASLCIGDSFRISELEKFTEDHSICVLYKAEDYPDVTAGTNNIEVLSITGVTTFDEPAIHEAIIHLRDTSPRKISWVNVSHPFNLEDVSRSLIEHSNLRDSDGQSDPFDDKDWTLRCHRLLYENYLIIITGLQSTEEWDKLKEAWAFGLTGSCIIIITDQNLAAYCVSPKGAVYNLEDLEVGEALALFVKKETAKEKAARKYISNVSLRGRTTAVHQLKMKILSGNLEVVSVWGIAGVGKSSLVRSVYSEQVLRRGPFEKFGWVNVPRPFNLRDLSQNLILDLHSESLQQGNPLRIDDPVQECRNFLHEHRFLIVIDGLQSTEEWDQIKLAHAIRHSPSKVVVIRDEECVAKYCFDDKYAACEYNVRGLDFQDAYDLFMEKAKLSDLSSEAEEQIKLIVPRCGGLPKVIIPVANFINNFHEGAMPVQTWRWLDKKFMYLMENFVEFNSLEGLFSWVRSYFRSCPDFLKPCIFYLSIFPVNHSIRRKRLVRRWISEGYARDTKGSTAEETAEEFFSKLVKLSIIQLSIDLVQNPLWHMVYSELRVSSCQVNGFFREYILSRPMEENLVFALEGSCRTNSQRSGRHLTIRSTWDRDRIVFQSIDFSRLRSLTVFGEWQKFFINNTMSLLRVLDLEDTTGVQDGDIEEMVEKLPRLKFLSLRGCKQVMCLPDSLGGLKQLQTLDIRGTSITALPSSITSLHRLQYIRAGKTPTLDADGTASTVEEPTVLCRPFSLAKLLHTSSATPSCCHLAGVGVVVPAGIEKMEALQTLGVIDVSVARGKTILKELKELTQLRKLGVYGVNCTNSKVFLSAISDRRHMEYLSIWIDKDSQDVCLDNITPPENLHSLKLYGQFGKLPGWIKELRYLSKVRLHMTTSPIGVIDALRVLPNLQNLSLFFKEFHEDGKLKITGCFRELSVLEIACNSSLQAVQAEFHHSSLQVLKIHCLSESPVTFDWLHSVGSLKEVSLSGLYDDELKQRIQVEIDANESKPVLRVESCSS